MTTREWFRILRGELWRTDPGLAKDLDTIATVLTAEAPHHQYVGEYVRIGSVTWMAAVQEYEERARVLALVRADMEAAMRQLFYVQRILE